MGDKNKITFPENSVNVFIGLGANIGDRENNIKKAVSYLKDYKSIRIERLSSLIETFPEGGPPQGKYLNGVIKIKTTLKPKELLCVLLDIEERLGRVRGVENGPRVIDLDILLYGYEKIDEPELKVPHPSMFKRKFVMDPLSEIASEEEAKNIFRRL